MCKMYKGGMITEQISTKFPFYKACNGMFIMIES